MGRNSDCLQDQDKNIKNLALATKSHVSCLFSPSCLCLEVIPLSRAIAIEFLHEAAFVPVSALRPIGVESIFMSFLTIRLS